VTAPPPADADESPALSAEDRDLLARHVTAPDDDVFALTGLPEVVKGALFARYSRSPKSLKDLLLDEFAEDLRGEDPAERPRSSTSGCSPSTATTRSRSSAGRTWRSRTSRTC
jgi:hypothetical protein